MAFQGQQVSQISTPNIQVSVGQAPQVGIFSELGKAIGDKLDEDKQNEHNESLAYYSARLDADLLKARQDRDPSDTTPYADWYKQTANSLLSSYLSEPKSDGKVLTSMLKYAPERKRSEGAQLDFAADASRRLMRQHDTLRLGSENLTASLTNPAASNSDISAAVDTAVETASIVSNSAVSSGDKQLFEKSWSSSSDAVVAGAKAFLKRGAYNEFNALVKRNSKYLTVQGSQSIAELLVSTKDRVRTSVRSHVNDQIANAAAGRAVLPLSDQSLISVAKEDPLSNSFVKISDEFSRCVSSNDSEGLDDLDLAVTSTISSSSDIDPDSLETLNKLHSSIKQLQTLPPNRRFALSSKGLEAMATIDPYFYKEFVNDDGSLDVQGASSSLRAQLSSMQQDFHASGFGDAESLDAASAYVLAPSFASSVTSFIGDNNYGAVADIFKIYCVGLGGGGSNFGRFYADVRANIVGTPGHMGISDDQLSALDAAAACNETLGVYAPQSMIQRCLDTAVKDKNGTTVAGSLAAMDDPLKFSIAKALGVSSVVNSKSESADLLAAEMTKISSYKSVAAFRSLLVSRLPNNPESVSTSVKAYTRSLAVARIRRAIQHAPLANDTDYDNQLLSELHNSASLTSVGGSVFVGDRASLPSAYDAATSFAEDWNGAAFGNGVEDLGVNARSHAVNEAIANALSTMNPLLPKEAFSAPTAVGASIKNTLWSAWSFASSHMPFGPLAVFSGPRIVDSNGIYGRMNPYTNISNALGIRVGYSPVANQFGLDVYNGTAFIPSNQHLTQKDQWEIIKEAGHNDSLHFEQIGDSPYSYVYLSSKNGDARPRYLMTKKKDGSSEYLDRYIVPMGTLVSTVAQVSSQELMSGRSNAPVSVDTQPTEVHNSSVGLKDNKLMVPKQLVPLFKPFVDGGVYGTDRADDFFLRTKGTVDTTVPNVYQED